MLRTQPRIRVVPMRMKYRGKTIPYPLTALKGRLRLSGLSRLDAESAIAELQKRFSDNDEIPAYDDLISACRKSVRSMNAALLDDFDLLERFNSLRRKGTDTQPLVLVLEGASATGKSMLALDLIVNLAVTRIISTDTIRQVIRTGHSPDEYPELYTHTYQAHIHKQTGPEDLHPVVRGYIAQCEHIMPAVNQAVERVLNEGAEAIVEGVHITPGSLQGLGAGVVEVLINPPAEVHRIMFLAKCSTSGLKTVSDDIQVRHNEFEGTRLIQDYMLKCAAKESVEIVTLVDYEGAIAELNRIVMRTIRQLIATAENK